jgi:hypothetical protein
MKSVLELPVALLARATTRQRSVERVKSLALAYTSGRDVPPIPVRLTRGMLQLDGDGNHRLAAVRLAGVTTVRVSIDSRVVSRLLVSTR